MELWIPITIGSAFLQNLRSTLQKHLKSSMGTTGATFVRFGFGIPFAFGFVALLHFGLGQPIPAPNPTFLFWMVLGGLAQIGAQALLVHMFSLRNFAVGNAYSRTEPAQAALFGLVFLGEAASLGAIVAIAISVFGVMLISVARTSATPRALIASLGARPAQIGIASGTLFAVAAVSYRAASLSLGHPGFMMQAATTLAWVIMFQSIILMVWMVLREPDELGRIAKAWKTALVVGFVGATASFGWFSAMTLQQAAIVKALAQIEMLFSFASAVFVFKETITRLEVMGCLLISTGIIALLVFG
jgi:drug/metabolite transporter (DMT)-like permease